MSVSVRPPETIHYPDSDGKPMAENDWQRRVIHYALIVLENRYAGRPDVYVSGDLLIYYEEGNPRASVVPNVFVVFGAEKRKRMNYKLWEEPKAPDFVLEVASPGRWREHEGPKRALYERLGVREYFQHDPLGEHLPSPLQGRRLVRGAYEPLPVVPSPGGTLLLHSETLELDLLVDRSGKFRFRDPVTGEFLLSLREVVAARQQAESRAETARQGKSAAREQEEAARRTAEARIAELEALLALRRG